MSDKDGVARKAAVNVLHIPFMSIHNVDFSVMENFVKFFLERIADTMLDKEHTAQEYGMKLLLQF